MKKFIAMMGLPRSGKSTYVDKHLSNYQIICADDIRLALGTQFDKRLENFVWAIHDCMVNACLIRGLDIVIDATNTTEKKLRQYKLLADSNNYKFKTIFINTSPDECHRRNEGKGAVPKETIERMADQISELFLSMNRKINDNFDLEKELNIEVIKC